LAAMQALAREIGHPRYLWRPLLARAMRMMMSGRLDEADRLRAEAASTAGRIEDPNFPVAYAMQAWGLGLERRDADELRAAGARLEEIFTGMPGDTAWRPVMTSLSMVRAGFVDDARSEWARVPHQHPMLTGESLAIMLAGEVAAVLGDRER